MKQIPDHRQHGFTLIEIIGVLAIMSIMAATIAPSAIQMITSSKQTSENKALTAISDALRLYVQTNKKVPAATAAPAIVGGSNVVAWDKAIGAIMNVAATKVSTNNINKQRIYLYPADFITASSPTPPLPYDQTVEISNLNTAAPNNGILVTTIPDPRVMVISNMNPGVTLATTSGSKAIDLFNAIWNQATVNATAVPLELSEGDKLKISRINLTDLFVVSKFSNSLLADPYQAAIQIDGLPAASYTWARNASTRNSITVYLIAGSAAALRYQETASGIFTTYDTNIMQPTSQKNFYFSGAVSPAAWSVTQAGADAVAANANNNNNNNGGSVSFTANANGVVAINPQSGCTSNATPTLTVWALDQTNGIVNDYYLYYGDSNGNIVAPIQTGNTQGTCADFGGGNLSNKINTNDTDCRFAIPECSMVVIVPKAKPNNNAQTTFTSTQSALSIFYMPATAKTVTLP